MRAKWQREKDRRTSRSWSNSLTDMCRDSQKHVSKWQKPEWKEKKLRGKRRKPQGKKDGSNRSDNKCSKSHNKRRDQSDDPCRNIQSADLRVSDEGIFKMISKKEFIRHLEALIIADGRSCVQNIVYTKKRKQRKIKDHIHGRRAHRHKCLMQFERREPAGSSARSLRKRRVRAHAGL